MSLNSNTELGLINTTANAGSITLPSASISQGRVINFKDSVGRFGTNTLTLNTSGGDTFEDGSALKTLRENNGIIQIVASGTTWYVLTGTQENSITVSTLQSLNTSSVSISSGNLLVSSLQYDKLVPIYQQSSLVYFNSNIFAGSRVYPQTRLNTYTPNFIFNPNSISNLSFWFDASVSTSMAVSTNSTILFWNSLSTTTTAPSNIRNTLTLSTTINVLSNRGLYAPNTLNGFGGVNLSTSRLGTNNLGASNAPLIYYNNILDSEFTTICLVNRLFTGTPNANNPSVYTVQLGGNIRVACATGFYTYISPGNFTNTNSIVMSCNVPIIYTGSRQSGNQFVRFNGSNTSSSNFTTNTFIPSAFNYYIGDDTYNDFFSGNLHEIVHYRYGLSLSDITRVEGYLAWKYNIQSNLISTHPYRYIPPY